VGGCSALASVGLVFLFLLFWQDEKQHRKTAKKMECNVRQ
jgi:hypothetical protein